MTGKSKMDFDFCVIGAGVIGSATAYHLSNSSGRILLLEQYPLCHSRGSSHGHSRITRYSYRQQHYLDMIPEAYKLWKDIGDKCNTNLQLTTGLLDIEREPYNVINAIQRRLKKLKLGYRRLSNEELRQNFPVLKFPSNYEALYDDSGGILKADRCCQCLQQLFIANGGTIRELEKVTKIIPGDTVTIITSKSLITAQKVIITAGAWTAKLTKPLGLDLPLKPLRINVCYWKVADDTFSADAGFPCFRDFSTLKHYSDKWSIYGLPALEYPNMIKVCTHDGYEIDPEERDKECDDKDIKALGRYLAEYYQGVEGSPSIVERCFYTSTPDGDYILDYHPLYRNIVIGAGFSGALNPPPSELRLRRFAYWRS